MYCVACYGVVWYGIDDFYLFLTHKLTILVSIGMEIVLS